VWGCWLACLVFLRGDLATWILAGCEVGVEGIYTVEKAVPRFQSFVSYYMVEEGMSGIVFLLQVFML